MTNTFEPFSLQHFGVLIVFALFTFLAIWFGLNSNDKGKKGIGFGISFIAAAIMIFDLIYRLFTGTFDILKDLPFFLCDFVVIILPFVILHRNRKWLGILYFWVVAGTLQALLTPDLEDGFPDFNYFRYFIMHAGIVTAVIYCIIVYRIKITWKDFLNAIIYSQLYLIVVHFINIILNSNYSYTMKKPSGTTILDFLGEWPWYIFFAELLMVFLFLLLMVPFLFKKQKPLSTQQDI